MSSSWVIRLGLVGVRITWVSKYSSGFSCTGSYPVCPHVIQVVRSALTALHFQVGPSAVCGAMQVLMHPSGGGVHGLGGSINKIKNICFVFYGVILEFRCRRV